MESAFLFGQLDLDATMDRMPTLKQMQYFAALAEAGHYRKAAEKIGISQPSLSQQILNLEAVLRLTLVERGRAGAVLTPAGREVLGQCNRILSDVATLVDLSERIKGGMAGTIRLGSSPALGPYFLPKVLRDLHRDYPSLRLFVRDGTPRALVEDLLDGRHDMILTQLPIHSSDVTVQRLFRERLYLAVARDHPLAERENVEDSDLAGLGILTLSSAYNLHTQVAGLARESEAYLRLDYEGTSLDSIRQMVAMNMGVAFLPALYAASEIPNSDGDVVLLPFRRNKVTRSVGLAWRKTTSGDDGHSVLAQAIKVAAERNYSGLISMER